MMVKKHTTKNLIAEDEEKLNVENQEDLKELEELEKLEKMESKNTNDDI